MNQWDAKRRKKLREYVSVTFAVSVFIIFMAVIMAVDEVRISTWHSVVILAAIVGALAIFSAYLGPKILERAVLVDKPSLFTHITTALFFVVIASIIIATGGAKSAVKILFFLPVMLYAGQHGRRYGLLLTVIVGLFIFALDLLYCSDVFSSKELEIDIIGTSILILLAWLLGGLADIEKEIRKELIVLANRDELTELENHRGFQEKLESCLRTAKDKNETLGLIMIDIDYFKFYNDAFGHQQGDAALKQFGQILKTAISEPAFAARYGGEEFAVVLPNCSKEMALEIGEKIRSKVENFPFFGAQHQPQGKFTASLGIAMFPEQANSKEELLSLADDALYRAKYSNKNKVKLYFSVFDDLRKVVDESEKELLMSLRTLISIINSKDRYTYGHSERTSLYAIEFGKFLGFGEAQVSRLKYGAFLHDIGKIEIDRNVLNTKERLTKEEWSILIKHPLWGADIIRPIKFFEQLCPIIKYHHENYDGSGYPDGLHGADIPLEAQILRIIDSYDAMTTNRVYKPAVTSEEALNELIRYSGIHYNPALVGHFITFIRTKWQDGSFSLASGT